jgi:hypothetical protein
MSAPTGRARPPHGSDAHIPRWQLWSIAAMAAAGIIGLAYVTGYEAGQWQRPGQTAEVPAVPPSPASARAPVATPPAPPAAEPASSAVPDAEPETSPTTAGDSASFATPPPGPMRAQVAAYFSKTDAILASAKQGGDPYALAQRILKQTVAGEGGGIDDLIATQKALAERLRDIPVPSPCVEHHRRSLIVIEKGIDLLRDTADAIRSEELSGLAALGPRGQEIDAEARAIDALARSIKGQQGLP